MRLLKPSTQLILPRAKPKAVGAWLPSWGTNVVYSNGNRQATISNSALNGQVRGTVGRSSGKYAFEITRLGNASGYAGFCQRDTTNSTSGNGFNTVVNNLATTGHGYNRGSFFIGNAQVDNNATLMVAVDIDNSFVWFVCNGGYWSLTIRSLEEYWFHMPYYPSATFAGAGGAVKLNCGQEPFVNPSISGFLPWG